ncbi:restriction endonuclease subunit S [Draconibacterium orientale]|uniref:restriction endonuclease subunit S n=1 Tax=Draconibacterium orientale TaxID=1168034 RepID=UPI0029C0A809|nr:restriction endonuclease subunit S [Draconibacterium orientale]
MIEVKLKDYIQLTGGGTPSKENDTYWNGKIPWASVKDLKSDYITSTVDTITKEGVENSATNIIPANTLLIATRMAVGKVAFAQVDMAINQDLKAISCRSGIDKKFLFYLLKSKSKYFEKISSGATVKGIKINHILDLYVPLPPLPTQKKIAAILDAADAYRQKTKALIEKYDQLAQALFLDMFGDPVVNPKGWKKVNLKTFIQDVKNGITRRPKTIEDNTGDKVLKLKHIRANYINYDCENRIKLTALEKEKFDVQIDDLLFIRVNGNPDYVGRCAIHVNINETVYYNDHIMRVRLNKKQLNIIFSSFFLNSTFGHKEILQHVKTSAGQHTINQQGLEKIKFIYPPVALQNKFAKELQLIEQQKQQALASLQKAEDLFNSLLQRAFKGELVKE